MGFWQRALSVGQQTRSHVFWKLEDMAGDSKQPWDGCERNQSGCMDGDGQGHQGDDRTARSVCGPDRSVLYTRPLRQDWAALELEVRCMNMSHSSEADKGRMRGVPRFQD